MHHLPQFKCLENHLADFGKAFDFVEAARKAGGKVLSHCWYEEKCSVTLPVAYFMKYEGMGQSEANRLIHLARPQAKPCCDSLEEYSEHLEKVELKEDSKIGSVFQSFNKLS